MYVDFYFVSLAAIFNVFLAFLFLLCKVWIICAFNVNDCLKIVLIFSSELPSPVIIIPTRNDNLKWRKKSSILELQVNFSPPFK